MRELKLATNFKKDLKLMRKRQKDLNKLYSIVKKIVNEEQLDEKYDDHALANDKHYKNARDCHIESDWILIYRLENDSVILLLLRTGTHSDLF